MNTVPSDPKDSIALTYQNLHTVDNQTLTRLSQLTLAEIEELKQVVSRMVPAGNLPGFLLHGLVKLEGRAVPQDRVRREVGQLIRGLVDKGLYGSLVMGPAAVLNGYQKLLKLAGKDVAAAFPQGTWQFYTEFALREDQARHTSEALGFHQALSATAADETTMLAAWLRACAWTIMAYDMLLTNEWNERMSLRLIREAVEGTVMAGRLGHWPSADESTAIRSQSDGLSWLEQERDRRLRQLSLQGLSSAWTEQRPYWHPPEVADYPAYRRAQFQAFVDQRLPRLSATEREFVQSELARRKVHDLPAYLAQMHLLYALQPEGYRENRVPIPLWQARLAVVAEGCYFLVPVCACDPQGRPLVFPLREGGFPQPLVILEGQPLWQGQPAQIDRRGVVRCAGQPMGWLRPATPGTFRLQAQTILRMARDLAAETPAADLALVAAPRAQQENLRGLLPPGTQAAIGQLRLAPIVINWHHQRADQPLVNIRRGRRGIGDHALTIYRTERSVVFDLSHIFFDGTWGVALAQIMTHAATEAHHAVTTASPQKGSRPVLLDLSASPSFEATVVTLPHIAEVSAETTAIRLDRINRMRGHVAQRGVGLTVNDVLLLGRSLFDPRYRPGDALRRDVATLARADDPAVRQAGVNVESLWQGLRTANPSVLIPMDASAIDPKQRVFPTTFRNPFSQIDEEWTRAATHLAACLDNQSWTEAFLEARKEFFSHLRYFGLAMSAIKQTTMKGDSWNTAVIRLLAHLPPGLQHALDWIPQEFEVLNEILKGDEVFSNVGQMAPGSSISRFASAKDDGHAKVLVWGILSDAEGQLTVTLRDFRPHVAALEAIGQRTLAQHIAQDYLNGYAILVNQLVSDLDAIATHGRRKKR